MSPPAARTGAETCLALPEICTRSADAAVGLRFRGELVAGRSPGWCRGRRADGASECAVLSWPRPGATIAAVAFERMIADPTPSRARPRIRGLRISVEPWCAWLPQALVDEIVDEHPDLNYEDMKQALEYAASAAELRLRTIALYGGRSTGRCCPTSAGVELSRVPVGRLTRETVMAWQLAAGPGRGQRDPARRGDQRGADPGASRRTEGRQPRRTDPGYYGEPRANRGCGHSPTSSAPSLALVCGTPFQVHDAVTPA